MTDVETGAALLRGILDHPEDDAARLVYADWLEDNSQSERAEFIRVQVRLTELLLNETPSRAERVECARLLDAELRLAMANVATDGVSVEPRYFRWCVPAQPEWVAETQFGTVGRLYGGPDGGRSQRGFHRGFVREIHAPLNPLLAHGEAILAAHPVERLVVSDREPQNYHTNGGFRLYGWLQGPANEALLRHALPAQLWAAVTEIDGAVVHGSWADFDAEDAANAALSTALLALLRKE